LQRCFDTLSGVGPFFEVLLGAVTLIFKSLLVHCSLLFMVSLLLLVGFQVYQVQAWHMIALIVI